MTDSCRRIAMNLTVRVPAYQVRMSSVERVCREPILRLFPFRDSTTWQGRLRNVVVAKRVFLPWSANYQTGTRISLKKTRGGPNGREFFLQVTKCCIDFRGRILLECVSTFTVWERMIFKRCTLLPISDQTGRSICKNEVKLHELIKNCDCFLTRPFRNKNLKQYHGRTITDWVYMYETGNREKINPM